MKAKMPKQTAKARMEKVTKSGRPYKRWRDKVQKNKQTNWA